MARARNIKPGFFKNDTLCELPPLARLLFAGLWTICDREGRLEDRPRRIKAEVLVYDDCDVDVLLSQLAAAGFVVRYTAGGANYIQIVNFHKHQDPHYKEKASEIPPPDGHAGSAKTPGGPPEAVRQAVFDRDGRACKSCGATDDLSLDHIVPRSMGGSHDESNLQTLCRRCNSAKSNREAKLIVGQSSADDPGNKPPLNPDSLNLIPDSSVAKATDAGASDAKAPNPTPEPTPAPTEPPKSAEELTKAELWTAGKSLLLAAGMPKAQCGTFVGKLVIDYGDQVVVEAVRSAVMTQPADPSEYLKACCLRAAGKRQSKGSPYQQQRAARMAEAVPALTRFDDGKTIDAEVKRVAS